MAIYAVVVFAVCWFFFKETQQPDYAPLQGGTREVFSSRSFWAWSSVSATSFGGMFCFLLFSPAIYIEYLGLSPMAYGWIPASGSLVYILSTTWCRHLLSRHSVVRTVQWGSQLSLLGGLIQLAAGTWATHSFWVLLFGHWVFALGHGIHQPCGQAGAVSDFPKLAGRAVAWSGFVMMAVAFVVGQTLAPWMISGNSNGAWPLIVPMAVAGLGLVVIAYGWLPKAATPQGAS
jgi:DHA1 family bicyclomycin/chloramphenicol resistance-like MFS transporter